MLHFIIMYYAWYMKNESLKKIPLHSLLWVRLLGLGYEETERRKIRKWTTPRDCAATARSIHVLSVCIKYHLGWAAVMTINKKIPRLSRIKHQSPHYCCKEICDSFSLSRQINEESKMAPSSGLDKCI